MTYINVLKVIALQTLPSSHLPCCEIQITELYVTFWLIEPRESAPGWATSSVSCLQINTADRATCQTTCVTTIPKSRSMTSTYLLIAYQHPHHQTTSCHRYTEELLCNGTWKLYKYWQRHQTVKACTFLTHYPYDISYYDPSPPLPPLPHINCAKKNIPKIRDYMEVGGWVQVSLGIFLFWRIIPK